MDAPAHSRLTVSANGKSWRAISAFSADCGRKNLEKLRGQARYRTAASATLDP